MNCDLKRNRNKAVCKKSVGEAEFKIILPKYDNSGRPIKHKILSKYISKMNKRFGGTTTTPTVKGCYSFKQNGKDVFQCEKNLQIMAVRDFETPYNRDLRKKNANQRRKLLKQDYSFMQGLAKYAGKELGQESVFVESDYINDASILKGRKSNKLRRNKLEGKKAIEFLTD